jgi:hypothetical protein
MRLPSKVGGWALKEPARRIEPAAIFDYMDGAGELYLAYRLQHVDVYNYIGSDETEILVEIYHVESSDDAYGLLSLDWGGERAELTTGGAAGSQTTALYGAGLLRIWSGDIYARVMAEAETTESRAAVLELGRAIVAGRSVASRPRLLDAIPAAVGDYRLVNERVAFLRSHLVLNSIYFLSSQNIHNLDARCEAVSASYRAEAGPGSSAVRLVEIRYPSYDEALAAMRSFEDTYVFEKQRTAKPAPDSTPSYSAPHADFVEDGWMARHRAGRTVILVFECPNEAVAKSLLDRAIETLQTWEKNHD